PAGDGLVDVGEARPGNVDPTRARMHEAREQVRDVFLAALVASDERDVLAGPDREREPVDPVADAVLAVAQRARRNFAGERRNRLRRILDQLAVDEPRGLELRDRKAISPPS